MVSKKLLDILVCPRCKGELSLEENKLVCPKGNIAFPIKNDIPIIVMKEAIDLGSN
tara:strand:- start:327 stop:494 length:168 start_codon:yes stop_codon:yes gene_type:complete